MEEAEYYYDDSDYEPRAVYLEEEKFPNFPAKDLTIDSQALEEGGLLEYEYVDEEGNVVEMLPEPMVRD